MLPAASSGAPLAILAKAKIVQRPKITHWIKRPHERFIIKGELADATSDRESVKGRALASRFKPGEARQIHGVAGEERRRRAQPSIQSTTSDNICHIKSVGVGVDCRRTHPRRA